MNRSTLSGRHFGACLLAAIATLATPLMASAADAWPAKPLRLIVPFPPGGAAAITQSADARDTLARQGLDALGGSGEQFARQIDSDMVKWARVVRAGSIAAQ